MMRSLPVYLLPLLEAILFFSALSMSSMPLAVATIFLAAVCMCLSLHISYHEAAHHCANWHPWLRLPMALLLTVLMGVSFHAYRMGHFNHHRYNNRLDDFTSTWRESSGDIRPWNPWWYCLSWPRNYLSFPRQLRKAAEDGHLGRAEQAYIAIEGLALLVLITGLFYVSARVALLYVLLVYLGWALIALQNYGQHLPDVYGKALATSYEAGWYNRLLFNNGLHYEHHKQPGVPIRQLEPDPEAPRVDAPHLLAPLVHSRIHYPQGSL